MNTRCQLKQSFVGAEKQKWMRQPIPLILPCLVLGLSYHYGMVLSSVCSCHSPFLVYMLKYNWTYQTYVWPSLFSPLFFRFPPPPGSQGGNNSAHFGTITLSELEDSLTHCFELHFLLLWLAHALLGNIIVSLCFFILNKTDALL